MTPQQENFFNLINLLSFALGVENLQENRQQSAFNNVHTANDKQAEFLIGEIKAMFEEQNKKIDEILKRLEMGDLNG